MQIIYPIIATIIILLAVYLFTKPLDHFAPYRRSYSAPIDDVYYGTHTNFPFWNTQLGSRRGMSYDLRGDIAIPDYINMPFNMSSRIPIRNRPLYMVS